LLAFRVKQKKSTLVFNIVTSKYIHFKGPTPVVISKGKKLVPVTYNSAELIKPVENFLEQNYMKGNIF